MKRRKRDGFQTLCVHEGEDPERFYGAVAPPIFENSLFSFPDWTSFRETTAGRTRRYIYTRGANPTVEAAEAKIAALEGGEAARCFASGMAAISSAILSVVKAGDHIVAVKNSYGPTRQFLSEYMSRFGVETSFVDGRDLEEIEESIKPTTSLIYLESPSSVIFSLQDLQGVVREARRRGITTIIDNSCATPYNQHPLSYGIDLVVHTATKYLNGHSDVVSGAVVGRRELVEHIFTNERALLGGIPGPFEAWLLLRGIRTLGLRMERHNSSGLKIARFLENHPKVKRVYYPGLRSHPQHRLAARQMSGFSGLLSFDLGVTEKKVERLLDSLRLFYIAVSWGGFESLAVKASPAAPSDPDIPPNLIRLSIGLEEPEDLMEDLESALKKV